MQSKSGSTWILLLSLLALSGMVLGDGAFWNGFEGKQLSPASQDRNFEARVYGLLEQEAGVTSEYVRVTRFGNTIVITGEVKSSAQARVIDKLVLDIAGIKRKTNNGNVVVPEKQRDCGGKPVTGNSKRKLIVTGNKDCSSLRSDGNAQVRGRVYNHLAVAAPHPSMKVAAAGLLLAKAVVELVNAGYTQVLDSAVMRIVTQDGVFYIPGRLVGVERQKIKTILTSLPGVSDVRFYIE